MEKKKSFYFKLYIKACRSVKLGLCSLFLRFMLTYREGSRVDDHNTPEKLTRLLPVPYTADTSQQTS